MVIERDHYYLTKRETTSTASPASSSLLGVAAQTQAASERPSEDGAFWR